MRFVDVDRTGTEFVIRSKRLKSWEYETVLKTITPVELNDNYSFYIRVLVTPKHKISLDTLFDNIYSRTEITNFTVNRIIETDKVKEFATRMYAALVIDSGSVFATTDLMFIP